MARLGPEVVIDVDCQIVDSTFGAYCAVGRGSRIQHSCFGDYAYCDRNADIANTSVGKFANIASATRIGATDHPLDTAACHHFLYRSDDYWDDATRDDAFFAHRQSRRAFIGNDTWIGHGAMIKPEVTLGHGAVVASGAIVTKDVAPYTIVAGTPAKVLRLRQPARIADRLIALAWWDWSHDALRQALPDFRSLSAEAFLEKYEGVAADPGEEISA
ncbi:chloramphenicol acetyltransferase [Mesobacterium sp. TK19101]|uniref:Chloramphenicol acetyltransferase n=1 Tax=Mesobacterium hydrothermale TaxID=3111907 RepID=A0ABU6HJD8_9RHOB|nr:chloramphenicol acetyltransferase [Mesobacterium sp. TK19101]MEC3862573.1 chloramphenicol acetyltransferase [Mesobacterium sp. TK19101]